MRDDPSNPQRGQEERPDNAGTRRAFSRVVVPALLMVAVIGAILRWINRPPSHSSPDATLTSAVDVARAQAEIPVAKFTDITAAAGISFLHNNGAYGEKLLPETMGGGVAFFDFDNDGDQDLLFINSTWWPWKIPAGKAPTPLALYRNDGHGHFEDVTAGSGLDVSLYGMGVAVGDYDNDRLPDVFVTAVGRNHLFHNEGNRKFADVSASAGAGGAPTEWSTSAAGIDYDNDGRLDLVVCHYVRWTPVLALQANNTTHGIARPYLPPMNFH